MNAQTFYPVFANGQVLTSDQLNEIMGYLEPQDRLGRRLVGIGVVCGFTPDWDPGTSTLMLSAGMAVTSLGFMISDDPVVLASCRPYKVPVPSGDEASAEERERARYPYLFDGQTQREALELLPIDFRRAEGEPEPTPLSDPIVDGKTVVLFLERNFEELKNCDINDCSDRGSEVSLTLRRLLVARETADQMLVEEAVIAGRPVDRASHPRRRLAAVEVDKINPSRLKLDTVGRLHQRTLETSAQAFAQLLPALRDSWEAYRPLLQAHFPSLSFPDGPVPASQFLNAWAAYAEAPLLVQYLHALACDTAQSYKEFVECAGRYEAECCPDTRRFPLHVLAGDVAVRRHGFVGAPATLDDYKNYDPAAAQDGAAPEGPPAARRHHFIPSPAVGEGNDRLAEIRSLFARTILLAQTFYTRGLLGSEIRLTPSRDGAAPLGARAIPFHYRCAPGGDLIRNWSWIKARSETYGSIYSYQFSDPRNHPFQQRRDGEDFIRIEGSIGRPLGSTIVELLRQRRELGLSFAIEPVWLGWDEEAAVGEVRDAARRAMRTTFLCRLNQIEIVFATVMDSLFEFAVWLVRVLGTIDAVKAAKPPATAATPEIPPAYFLADFVRLQPEEQKDVRVFSRAIRSELKMTSMSANALVGRVIGDEAAITQPSAQPKNVAEIYAHVSDVRAGGELIDRLRDVVGRFDLPLDREDAIKVVYPSVALIARAQELMRATRGASLAEFDDDQFATVMRGFAAAYDAYAAVAETDSTKAGKEIANTNTAIIANRGFVAMMAAQFASGSMTGRVDQQVEEMFDELSLPRFAELNPGLEQKGGVPSGGTYVLVYSSRADLAKRINALCSDANAQLNALADRINVRGLKIDPGAVMEPLEASSRARGDDALEELVVVADFCLPYMCCEGRCADLEIERRYSGKPELAEPAPEGQPPPAAPVEPVAEPQPQPEPVPPPPQPVPPPPAPARGTGRLTIAVMLKRLGSRGSVATRRIDRVGMAAREMTRVAATESRFPFDVARVDEATASATRPLPGSQVSITNMQTGEATTIVMREAQITQSVPSGTYSVTATNNNVSSSSEQVTVADNEEKTLTLIIVMA